MGNQKSGMFVLICLAALIAVFTWYGAGEKNKEDTAQAAASDVKVKEVVGQVVGGAQIVSGSPLIGYAVYIEETKTWGALHANGCPPQLGNGSRVVMYQKGTLGEWYTFLRYEK
ncbi:MAG: hypothetical protein UY31_C0018G0005 [Candidatus Wolfebacteria bacterium GW2011_GWE1_48_7]|uniref:Uncharacterized protein n=2 Tax=Candidatus Wolfeibacteriota TaxID=1752735 RepID=A0A0G1X876_9BACT|nr:MAG: hypothetical protein UX70_C0001G0835 [Candidatus Wolfebacteria bacterium GW2011_GWB1_47_1]KKU42122.1 MAG: hypothetical protein UX58_C0003G0046 [Candidatus Wolfebacteria bacterium GW2011_GWB2_46_69]KKU54102.1 MAG: hypothetical protein UX76_C0006G0068 [Candidatus Wolfebacteria bacterium GW2011_GWC1_47_103]KKU59289.1 MAG: hypothetical protein UX83_C0006G0059 [Candidatus Wolfebacteria bacterium GW2011_GWE2_47_12]KKU66042.1 MAG: hypothetical protein UX90_C0001G0101 [Candidatus Wolfebacteria 